VGEPAVWLLWHSYEVEGCEDAKLIGVYSTNELAERARDRAAELPGFKDWPTDFVIDCYILDSHHWQEGFVSDAAAE
jgi:hypothetical protein